MPRTTIGTTVDAETVKFIIQELLTDELGSFSDDTPAIWIESLFDQASYVEGLACFIQDLPRQISDEKFQWDVCLIQFDPSTEGKNKWYEAIRKMRRRFPVARMIVMPENEMRLPQVRFAIPFERSAYAGF